MRGLARHLRDASLLQRAQGPEVRLPDEAELRQLLRARLLSETAPALRELRWQYARWKPGRSLALGFELEFEGGLQGWVAWKRYLDGKGERLEPQLREQDDLADDPLFRRRRARLDAETWVSAFPHDRVLPGLAHALDLQRCARELQALEPPGGLRLRWRRSSLQVLRYKPERRAVLRLEWMATDARRVPYSRTHALRVLTPSAAARCLAARQALVLAEMPRLLTARPEHGLLYEEWLALQPSGPALDEAGALLAKLHAQELPPGLPACPRLPPREDLEPLFEVEPALVRTARALALHDANGAEVCSHGDFHLDQLGLSERGAVLLDLDGLGRAPRTRDLASWIVDALLAQPELALEDAIESVLQPYARAGAAPPGAPVLRQALCAELVRRAAAGIRRLEAGALERAGQLLGRAQACLAPRPAPRSALQRGLATLARQLGPTEPLILQRADLDERGRATLMIVLPAGPRWFRVGDGGARELRLGQDTRLPGSALAGELIGRGAAELVSWRPGRRFVLRLPGCLRKGLRASRYAATLQRQEDFFGACRAASFRVARIVDRDATLATFDLEALPGRAFDFAADAAQAPALARMLEELQSLELPGLAVHSRAEELLLLDRLAERFSRAAGSLPAGWQRHFESLEQESAAVGRLACAQRDLFEAQILVDQGRLALLDFDLACKAEPELDPANLLAHLDLARARGRLGPRESEVFERAFLEACAGRHLLAEQPLCFYRAASLLRLALIWGLRDRGDELARSLLERVDALLDA